MAATTLELFRAGNKSSPRFDHLRPGEVVVINLAGVDRVVGKSGGASTFEAPNLLRGTWYRLPAGTIYNDRVLFLHNDYDDHWSWEPATDMPLADFVAELASLNQEFIRV